MLPFLNNHLHTKNLGFYLIPFQDINDQSVLQFDRTRRKPGQTQRKVVLPDLKICSPLLNRKSNINCVPCKILTKEHTKIYLEANNFHRKMI